MKKRYVRYRLISESSIIEQNGNKHYKPNVSEKTALQLLGEAAKLIGSTTVEATRLVYTALKQMGGTIITLIKKFIQKLPSIASKVFSVVYSMVKIFWNTFGKGFLNLLKGLAGICATFFGSLSAALMKASGGSNGNPNATGAKQPGGSNGTTSSKDESSLKQYIKNGVNPLSLLNIKLDNPNGNKKGEPHNNNYAPDFILSNRAIKILNEAANNPGMASKTLDNIIEKANPKFKNLCRRCINSNTAKTNPELACTIAASTMLVCGYPSPSDRFTNLQNHTNAKIN